MSDKRQGSQLDREIAQALAPNLYTAHLLGGAYKGKRADLSVILAHAVSDQPIRIGRLKRDEGEALCNKNYNTSSTLADSASWEPGVAQVTCPKCLEILARHGWLPVAG